MIKKKYSGVIKFCLPIAIALVFCMVTQGLSAGPAKKKTAPSKQETKQSVSKTPAGDKAQPAEKPTAATSFGIAEPQDAAAIFAEARKLTSTDPALAIQLYQRGLVRAKPDTWVERKELASLYEKQGQWNLALAEYQAINKAVASAESFTDVIRTLDAAGYPREAAASARKAFAQYPGQPRFLLLAGELFRKSGADDEALAVLKEYSKLKPKEGRPFFISRSIHEKAGRRPEALQDYLRAEKLLKDDRETVAALKRLRTGTALLGELTVFLPDGWVTQKDALINLQGGQRVTVMVKTSGEPQALALSSAREAMPPEPFSAEALKQNERMKKMRQELAKLDPEAAKKMPGPSMPLYSQGDFPEMKGAKKALFSTSETSQPGMESAVAIAVPKDRKIFIFLWRAALPATDGEKTLTQFIGQTVWPL